MLRILRKQLADALQRVEDGRRVSDNGVHAARKAIKRARATLRLLRPALTAAVFKSTNAALRDAARPLAQVRDAQALLDTMGSLRDYFADTANRVAPQDLERQLHAQKQERRREITRNRKLVDTLRRSLRKVAREVGRWSLDADDWTVLGPGMKRVYRSGLKALTRASAQRTDECLHEWRKHVKHLWHA
ncbi:MAG: CHAD domain-containing protein, partial [Steroidobacteraceae bacterium]